ncbi:hypothetical protein [Erwinia amylovora]|uniref:hypothetical protein n=1 Tax=Erwinia amylovora TaxID=552 RepID=UPI0039BCED3F
MSSKQLAILFSSLRQNDVEKEICLTKNLHLMAIPFLQNGFAASKRVISVTQAPDKRIPVKAK